MNGPRAAKHEGIIVLGLPRSGTTLVRRLLDAHPNISCPPETYLFTAAGRFLRHDRIGEGVRLGPLNGPAFSGVAPEEVLARFREFTFGIFRTIADKQKKPRWASKTPLDSFYLDEIEELCAGHAHFVCLVRHGGDTVPSLIELSTQNQAYMKELHDYVARHAFPDEAFAHLWSDTTRRLVKFAKDHPDDAILIRYEDLVAKPDEVIAAMFGSIGEAPDAGLVERALAKKDGLGLGDFKSTIDPSSVGRYKKLSPHTRSRLGAILNPTLVELGYEPFTVLEELTDVEARRRYEAGLAIQAMKRD
jgi:protein-tyrosine sulfotransferase